MLHLRIDDHATALNRYQTACGVRAADTYCTANVEHVNCESCKGRIREEPPSAILREEHSTEELLSLARKCDEVAIREGGHEPTYALAAANGYRLRVLLLSLGITLHTPRPEPLPPITPEELRANAAPSGMSVVFHPPEPELPPLPASPEYERKAARTLRGPGREPYRPPEIATDEQAEPLKHAAMDVCDRCAHYRHLHRVGPPSGCRVEEPVPGTEGTEKVLCLCSEFVERDLDFET